MSSQFTFKKKERLKSKKHIEELFRKGEVINLPPLRVLYLPCPSLPVHQVLFAVSKKKFKRAVTRNKLKRRMCEAYRLHKHLLVPQKNIHFLIGYIYIASYHSHSFKDIKRKLVASLQHLNQRYAFSNYESPQI